MLLLRCELMWVQLYQAVQYWCSSRSTSGKPAEFWCCCYAVHQGLTADHSCGCSQVSSVTTSRVLMLDVTSAHLSVSAEYWCCWYFCHFQLSFDVVVAKAHLSLPAYYWCCCGHLSRVLMLLWSGYICQEYDVVVPRHICHFQWSIDVVVANLHLSLLA